MTDGERKAVADALSQMEADFTRAFDQLNTRIYIVAAIASFALGVGAMNFVKMLSR